MLQPILRQRGSFPARMLLGLLGPCAVLVSTFAACGGSSATGGGHGGGTGTTGTTGTGGVMSTTGTGGTSAAMCTDGKKDGLETDVDCGGSACPPCATGKACKTASDCDSFVCTAMVCAGAQAWAANYGAGLPSLLGNSVAVDAAGRIATAGLFSDTLTFGATSLQSVSGGDIFGAKLASDGTPLWVKGYGVAGETYAVAIAAAPTGEVILTGNYTGTLDFGGGTTPIAASGGASDVFVAKLGAADGKTAWSKSFHSSTSSVTAMAAAVDGTGNVWVTGEFDGTITFGAGTTPPSITSKGNGDTFLLALDAAGNVKNAFAFGDMVGEQTGTGLAVDAAGDVYVAGLFSGSITFGGTTLNANGKDFFLAKLGSDGSPKWAQGFIGVSSAGYSVPWVAVDGAGDVLLSGTFGGTLTFNGGSTMLKSNGGSDIFWIKLDASGAYKHGATYGDTADQRGIATGDQAGNILVVGQNAGTITFGGQMFTSTGQDDVVVAKLDPTGAHLFSRQYGSPDEDVGTGIVAAGAHALVVSGYAKGPISFGGAPLMIPGGSHIFLADVLTP